MNTNIKLIEDEMLLSSLCTQSEYIEHVKQADLEVFSELYDISKDVFKM